MKLVSVSFTQSKSHRTDDGQASLVKAFEGAQGLDKGRCSVTKDLHIRSVDRL